MTVESAVNNGMYPIPDINEDLKYIEGLVYYKLDMRVADVGGGQSRLIHYVSDRRDRPMDNDVPTFLKREIVGHGQELVATKAVNVDMRTLDFRIAGEPTPYDLHIGRGCLLVIHLADRWNWQFQTGHAAVTTKANQGDKNRNLVHLDAGGDFITGLPTVRQPARYAYFTIAKRAAFETDHQINIHVEFDTRQIDILDPDIKNDGNQIPPPP